MHPSCIRVMEPSRRTKSTRRWTQNRLNLYKLTDVLILRAQSDEVERTSRKLSVMSKCELKTVWLNCELSSHERNLSKQKKKIYIVKSVKRIKNYREDKNVKITSRDKSAAVVWPIGESFQKDVLAQSNTTYILVFWKKTMYLQLAQNKTRLLSRSVVLTVFYRNLIIDISGPSSRATDLDAFDVIFSKSMK